MFSLVVTGTTGGTASTRIMATLPKQQADPNEPWAVYAFLTDGTTDVGRGYVGNNLLNITHPVSTTNWGLGTGRIIYVSGFYRI